MKAFALSVLAYIIISKIAFDSYLAALPYVILASDRLAAPYWWLCIFFSTLLSGGIFFIRQRSSFTLSYKIPLFIAVAMSASIVSVGLYADQIRHARVVAFNADAVVEQSFFRSIREPWSDISFFLHTAALKDCVPYAWSYRTMSFYELKANIAVNVVPTEWLGPCAIVRS